MLLSCSFQCDIKSPARRPLCSAALKFWFVKANFKLRLVHHTESVCPNVRLYQDCCAWCGPDSFVPLCRRHHHSTGNIPCTARSTLPLQLQPIFFLLSISVMTIFVVLESNCFVEKMWKNSKKYSRRVSVTSSICLFFWPKSQRYSI